MTDQQKRLLIYGGGAAVIAFIFLKSRKASALPPGASTKPEVVAVPAAGGGMPAPSVGTFKDEAGNLLVGPSTPITTPAAGAADTLKTIDRDESWSNLAARAYGDYRWWPFLWDYNRSGSTQFENPDKLLRGVTVKIPSLPKLSDSGFQSAIFRRAQLHLDYWKCRGSGSRRRCTLDASVSVRTPIPA
jgi:hypothetical protein